MSVETTNAVKNLFQHDIKFSGHARILIVKRMDSTTMLPRKTAFRIPHHEVLNIAFVFCSCTHAENSESG